MNGSILVSMLTCLGLLLTSCGQFERREEIGNGYSTVTREITERSTVFKVFRRGTDGKDRLVTQAHVESGSVQTFLPTPFAYGCTGKGYEMSSGTTETVHWGALGDNTRVIEIQVDTGGKFSMNGRKIKPSTVKNLLAFGKRSVVIATVELPISLIHLQRLVMICAGSPNLHGLVLVPAPQDRGWRPIELESDAEDGSDSEVEWIKP